MILIHSISDESSTSHVCEWIHYLEEKFLRLNGDTFLAPERQFYFELSQTEEVSTFLTAEGKQLSVDEITSIWYRRTGFPSKMLAQFKETTEDDYIRERVSRHLMEELKTARRAHQELWAEKKVLGNPEVMGINKLYALKKAKAAGMDIPATMITERKTQVVKWVEKYSELITKAIREGFSLPTNQGYLSQYTEVIGKAQLEALPETFFPSLFQEKLEKEIEIRTFFLDGECYSMAIFSQLDAQTAVDFRVYNNQKENRTTPYKLPDQLEAKIRVFMQEVGLNTGSLDIVKTKDKRYVFLEVNPVGQFGMVSKPCNYYLEKKIAQYLINPKS